MSILIWFDEVNIVLFVEDDKMDFPRTNEEKIHLVRAYQSNPKKDPLVCQLDPSHPKLEPRELDGEVVLACVHRGCKYVQDWIPSRVISDR